MSLVSGEWPCLKEGLEQAKPGCSFNQGIVLLQMQMVHKANQAVDGPLPELEYRLLRHIERCVLRSLLSGSAEVHQGVQVRLEEHVMQTGHIAQQSFSIPKTMTYQEVGMTGRTWLVMD